MSTRAEDSYATAPTPTSRTLEGPVVFGGIMMIVCGVYHALSGLAAVLQDQVYVSTPQYTYAFDLTAWGWAHLVLGALLVGVGVAVTQDRTWALAAGVALASLSLIANFLFLPHYPVWSIIVIAVDVVIIWALAARLRDR